MTAQPLRSRNWFGRQDLDGFVHRSWLKAEGFSDHVFDGRPVIGIANSWSELTNCNAHLRQVAEAVKRGVWSAGGFPLEFPTISLSEPLMKPTTMLFRNLMAMDVEECIRAYPLDAVVLLSGCVRSIQYLALNTISYADVPSTMLSRATSMGGVVQQLARGFRLSFDHYGRSSSARNHALTQHFARLLGEAGERIASRYLEDKGFVILERNVLVHFEKGDPFIEELRSRTRVIEHTTTAANKWESEMGLESLSFEFEMGRFRLPYKTPESRAVSGILEREARQVAPVEPQQVERDQGDGDPGGDPLDVPLVRQVHPLLQRLGVSLVLERAHLYPELAAAAGRRGAGG